MQACAGAHMWRPEVGVGCPSLILFDYSLLQPPESSYGPLSRAGTIDAGAAAIPG